MKSTHHSDLRQTLLRLCLALPLTIVMGTAPSGSGADASKAFRFADVDPRSLGLWEGDQPVFVYRHGIITREGVPADRFRSTYLHPIYGLDGEVLTDDFPADHYHHRGLFWGWPRVGIAGKNYDLWALTGIEQRFERWLARETSPARAILGVENGWYVGNQKVMAETVRFTVHPAERDRRAIDMEAIWTPVSEPITLAGAEGKSYGGLTLRYAPRQQTVITTPLGHGTNDLYITRLPWADLSAQFASAPGASGAAIFIAPDHPDFPPTWLTRHYGVLCVGWPGVQPQTLQPGIPIRCRYRIWIHRNHATEDQLQKAYQSFTNTLRADAIPATAKPRIQAVQESDRIRVQVDGKLFTEYQYPDTAKLPHFYPVIGPRSGQSITTKDADPYPHHASLWFGCDRVNGGNYWQEGLDRGQIRSKSLRLLANEPSENTVEIEHQCVWIRPGAEPPFHDQRRIRISVPSADRRIIDFDITLTALTDVRIEKSNHSLFAARIAPDLAVSGGGRLMNAEGNLGESGTFGKSSVWMDARGRRPGGITEGLTLLPSPSNPGHPVPWFTRDYGFLSPTPLFWLETAERRIAKGEALHLGYRVIIHSDSPSPDRIASSF